VSLGLHAAVAAALYALILAIFNCSGRHSQEPGASRVHQSLAAALAAAIFAVHPLRVEVVAWASCQPYLPCALFSVLAILAYLRAQAANSAGVRHRRAWIIVSLAFFAAALLSKAVAVTVPLVLLACDVYPLRRWTLSTPRSQVAAVFREKIPFLILAFSFVPIAVAAKRSNESLISIEHYGLPERLLQSCRGVSLYLSKTVWPRNLVAFYPLPRPAEMMRWPYLGSAVLVLIITLGVFAVRRRWPGLSVAWLVYLVVLAPNLGLVRIGNQLAADRYCYVPSMSLSVVLAFALQALIRWVVRRRHRVIGVSLASLLLIAALSSLSWRQCRSWRTTEELWRHAYDHGYATDPTVLVYLGLCRARAGDDAKAMELYAQAIRANPKSPDAHDLMGAAYARRGQLDEALREAAEAVRLEPRYAAAQNDLGSLLAKKGRLAEATGHFQEAIRIKPDFPLARRNLARALLAQGRVRAAATELREGVRQSPLDAMLHNDLGLALAQSGDLDQAVGEFREALRMDPSLESSLVNLGMALEQKGNLEAAITRYADAVRIQPANAANHDLLASALARAGRSEEARDHFKTALRLDPGDRDARNGLEAIQRNAAGAPLEKNRP
jgi:Flp pilus assembly protein TadD